MDIQTQCPKCKSENIYAEGNLWICPECGNEWSAHPQGAGTSAATSSVDTSVVLDAHGNVLNDGDAVTVIKELKIKGSSSVVKVGTKVKNIRLTDGDDGHNISCRIEGIGAMNLKSAFVKKA